MRTAARAIYSAARKLAAKNTALVPCRCLPPLPLSLYFSISSHLLITIDNTLLSELEQLFSYQTNEIQKQILRTQHDYSYKAILNVKSDKFIVRVKAQCRKIIKQSFEFVVEL